MPPQALLKAISPSESQIQKLIIDYIRHQHQHAFVCSIPNAAKRSFATAAFFKSQGLVSGVADLLIAWKGGRVAFMEVKTPTGRLSNPQKVFADKMQFLSIPIAVVHSLEEAQTVLKLWGVR